ncbi:MAG: homocysteine S-methyltransferase family protein, partial [Syntrophales bacterium LBB04]|nr:homocysteine S-methyltransferase family protein [Syntrophales bacterium LBB04]
HEYAAAGADILETNSFGANRIKLRAYGLAEKVRVINQAAVRIAREAAKSNLYVAGSVGPCLKPGQILTTDSKRDIVAAFDEQIAALVEEGIDFLMLETFHDLQELQLAVQTAHKYGVPVFASFTVNEKGETAHGASVETMVNALDANPDVDVIGINCGVGLSASFDALEKALPLTKKPFSVIPNAGMPRQVEGRMLYLSNPEYFTEYCKRFIELGVRAIGGCCGTTPDHIRMAAKAIKSLSAVKRHLEIQAFPSETEKDLSREVPAGKRSRLAARLLTGHAVTSVELLPPRSSDMSLLLEKARECHLAGVDAINIPDGPRASSRVSPMIAAIAIRERIGIEPGLHYCSRD